MAVHLRFVDDAVVVSNLGRLMNDPRYSSAGEEVQEALDQGYRKWVLELADARDTGAPFLGVLMTLTRRIRQAGGEVVLVRVSRSLDRTLEEMKLEEFWDRYDRVEEALRAFPGRPQEGEGV